MNLTDFWNNENYINPPLTEGAVLTAENFFGVKLPDLLIELLKIQNGGYNKGFVFPMTVPTSYAEKFVPFPDMNGIVLNPNIHTIHNFLVDFSSTIEFGLPEGQIPLSGDGHYFVTLDYRKGKKPSISWIDTEMDQDIHIADSFEEFLNGLVSEDEIADE
jgi:hypothetical protein